MKVALWIIALCEIIKTAKAAEQLNLLKKATLADERRKKAVAKRLSDSIENLERKMGVEE